MKLVMAGLVLSLAGGIALAADAFPPLRRDPILRAALPAASPPVRLVKGARITFSPGQPTGLHLHPVSVVGVVTEGAFVFQPEGERVRVLHVGDAFFEPAGRRIQRFDNASPSQRATIEAFYLTDSDARPLIEMLGASRRR